MFKKLRKNEKGFTLAELLIVVAIIGVLVAVSIPIFTSQLEKSREATDLANLRAAKAAAVAAYLTEDDSVYTTESGEKKLKTTALYYNAGKGVIDSTGDVIGKGTKANGGCTDTTFGTETYTNATEAAGKKIQVVIATDGTVTCKFVAAS